MQKKMQNYVYKILLILVLLISNGYLIYNFILLQNIENIWRYFLITILFIITIILLLYIKKKEITFSKGTILCTYFLLLIISASSIHKVYLKIDSMSVAYNVTSNSLIKLKNNAKQDNYIYGIIKQDVDSFNELKENAKLHGGIINADSYFSLVSLLYSGEVDYIYVPSNYIQMFSEIETYNNIGLDTEVIYTKTDKKSVNSTNKNLTKDAFSLLIMGVDSSNDSMIDSSFNGDALLLITFNPNNFNTTILSIPRDTYTNITCFNDERKNKITHAAWYGEDCMIASIEKMFNMKIDYFVKINFKGFVSLVDLLGGIDIDVPINFCEQDSNRSFENLICIDKGYNHLNGEEALALTRHRKTINDFIRGDNQKLVATSILEKVKNIDNVSIIYSILDTISNNVITNIKTEDILSLYNVVKKLKNTNMNDKIYTLKIEGMEDYIYDYSTKNGEGMNLLLYEFIPYIESIEYISQIMKNNLNNEEINISYPSEMTIDVQLLPDFTEMTKQEVISYCEKNKIKLNINYVVASNTNNYIDEVISQSIPAYMDLDYINDEITIDVVNEINNITNEKINCSIEENKDNNLCIVPNFIGKTYEEFKNWVKNNNYSFLISEEKISSNNKDYDKNKKGIIVKQNYKDISIYEILGKKFKITYIES